MPDFPDLPSRVSTPRGRIGQRDIAPTATRRRHQLAIEREFTAIVAPSGSVGDFSNIQEAINFVNNLGGGRIFIRNGTYKIEKDIIVSSNTAFAGEDNNNTIIDFNSQSRRFKIFGTSSSRKRNVHFSNLKVQASHASDNGAIFFNFIDDCSVTNCQFFDNFNVGAGNGGNVSFHNSTICLVENCSSDQSGDLVETNDVDVLFVRGNNVKDGLGYGANIVNAGEGITIIGNVFDNLDGPAVYIDTNQVTFSNNKIINFTVTAIRLVNDIDYGIISNNYLEGTGATAIGIEVDADNSLISGNIIKGDWDIGIHLDDGDFNIVSNNRIVDSDDAILIDNTCDRTLVHGNHTYGSTAGITDNGSNTTSADNLTA